MLSFSGLVKYVQDKFILQSFIERESEEVPRWRANMLDLIRFGRAADAS